MAKQTDVEVEAKVKAKAKRAAAPAKAGKANKAANAKAANANAKAPNAIAKADPADADGEQAGAKPAAKRRGAGKNAEKKAVRRKSALFPRRDVLRFQKNIPILSELLESVEDTPEKRERRERVLNPQTPEDRARYKRPETVYIICMVPRSGSTWLSHALRATNLMGLPHEHLNFRSPVTLIELVHGYGCTDRRTALEVLCRLYQTENGVFGLKTDFDQLSAFIVDGLFEEVFPDAKYIYQSRNNLLMQAMSRYKRRTRAADGSKVVPPKTDKQPYEIVLDRASTLADTMASWEYFFAARGILPLRMPYETIVADRDGQIRAFADYVGIPLPDDFALDGAADASRATVGISDEAREIIDARQAAEAGFCWEDFVPRKTPKPGARKGAAKKAGAKQASTTSDKTETGGGKKAGAKKAGAKKAGAKAAGAGSNTPKAGGAGKAAAKKPAAAGHQRAPKAETP